MAQPTTTTVYGKVISKPSQSIVKSKVDKLTGFKYPIESEPLRGYFSKEAGRSLVENMLQTLLRTYKGERFYLPNYGCNLKNYLMEPLDQTTFEAIKRDIVESVQRYLKLVTINKIQVYESQPNFGITTDLNVRLFCTIRDEANNNLDIQIRV